MIRLLAFDLDGTALTEHKYLSERNRAALCRAQEQGVLLVPATGRMLTFLPEVIISLPGVRYVISSNGAAVYDLHTGKPVHQCLIPNEKARQVQSLVGQYDIYVEYYREGRAVTLRGNPERAKSHFHFPREKWHFVDGKQYDLVDSLSGLLEETGLCPEKINLPYLEPEVHRELLEKLTELGGLKLTSSIPDNLEINDAGAHKGAALLALAEYLGLNRDELMAAGDNGNDVTMLKAAGCSVAMGDGSPEAIAAAAYCAAPHDRDGLAEAIEKYLFRKN